MFKGVVGCRHSRALKPNKTFVGIGLLYVFPLLGNLVIFSKPTVPFLHPPARKAQFIVQRELLVLNMSVIRKD